MGVATVTSSTCTLKLFIDACACGSAPPPTLVARSSWSKPPAPVPSGPSAIAKVSEPVPSATLSIAGVSSSVAVCAPAPEKRTTGVAVLVPERLTPVLRLAPDFSARRQSAGVTPEPPIDSGTSMVSPAISARPSVTVSSMATPSFTAPVPTRAKLTTVGSSSRMVTVAVFAVAEMVTPAGSALFGSAESVPVTTSSGSSRVSLLPQIVIVGPAVCPTVIVRSTHP